MKNFVQLTKLNPDDQVAIISPSSGLAGVFPWVLDLGIQRLWDIFELKAKEYPTTRMKHASLRERAEDIMKAFSDPENKAVIATIGGDDQIKLLKYLNPEILKANPKPFFGYSDNTHLHNYLWNLGIPSYYGGSILTQYGMHGAMYEETIASLKHAFFNDGEFELKPNSNFNDKGLDWNDKKTLTDFREAEKNEGFYWDGSSKASGILWGGCVESLIVQMASSVYLPPDNLLQDTILMIETSEAIPDPWLVDYLLTGFGERGWFDQFTGVLVGRPKAWEFNKQLSPDARAAYRKEQRRVVVETVRQYNSNIPIVQNLDFGHTDPQIVMPLGQKADINPAEQRIRVSY